MSGIAIGSVDGGRAAAGASTGDGRAAEPHGLATRPTPREPARRDWKAICSVDAIPRLGARRVRRDAGADVALFRAADDHVFALLDRCPHRGGPLSQGIVFGHSVACPLHNWTIELADGRARAPDVGCALTFAVMVEAGQVYLDLCELATRGVETVASPAA
jgi:nitrite reductase (NADH) small subunit